MDKDGSFGMMIVVGIVAIALFGGIKNTTGDLPISGTTSFFNQEEGSVEEDITSKQQQLEDLKKQLQTEEDKKTQSQYKDLVTLSYVNRSTDPNQEYIAIKVSREVTEPILVSGWTVKSINYGTSVNIPKGTYLFFSGMENSEENIVLNANDVVYLITGVSPVGSNFKVNKCSGYLGQFQAFVPYLENNCPLPENEDLSSIPKLTGNFDCFDHIDSMNRCKIQTEPLPVEWSAECKNFIQNKINYPSCINIHRYDSDFYRGEWRVYLKRSGNLWQSRREVIVLYDSIGKVVDTLTY